MAPRPFERSRQHQSSSSPTGGESPRDRLSQMKHIIISRVTHVRWIEKGPPHLIEILCQQLEDLVKGVDWNSRMKTFPLSKLIHVLLHGHFNRAFDRKLSEQERQTSMQVIVAVSKAVDNVIRDRKHGPILQRKQSDGDHNAAPITVSSGKEASLPITCGKQHHTCRSAFRTLSSNVRPARNLKSTTDIPFATKPAAAVDGKVIRKCEIVGIFQRHISPPTSSEVKDPFTPHSSAFSIYADSEDPLLHQCTSTKDLVYEHRESNLLEKSRDVKIDQGFTANEEEFPLEDKDHLPSIQYASETPRLPSVSMESQQFEKIEGSKATTSTSKLDHLSFLPDRNLDIRGSAFTAGALNKPIQDDSWSCLSSVSFSPMKKQKTGLQRSPFALRGVQIRPATDRMQSTSFNGTSSSSNDLISLNSLFGTPTKSRVDFSHHNDLLTSHHSKRLARWTTEEDQLLREAVREYGPDIAGKWDRISRLYFSNTRDACQCQNRWRDFIKSAQNSCNWESNEDECILRMRLENHASFAEIALELSGRTPTQVSDRFCNVLYPDLKHSS